ncbi:MAG: hypothetical protein RLY29_750 [Actinomycetota bacterium]
MAPFSFSGKGSSGRSNKGKRPEKRDRKPGDRKPGDRKPYPRREGSAGKPREDARGPKKPARDFGPDRRYRNFSVPFLPEDITGDELDKRRRAELRSLAVENAEAVAKHLVAIERFLESDPELAFRHGQEVTFRAGRVALVRELSGLAALRAGKYEIAQKDLRAAQRISGSKEVLPFIAQCEVALGNPRKALEIAGDVNPKDLSVSGRVELRIAAAKAREALGQFDAAVVTLTCSELNESGAPWSKRLRRIYRDALMSAGRNVEASTFEAKYPQSFID